MRCSVLLKLTLLLPALLLCVANLSAHQDPNDLGDADSVLITWSAGESSNLVQVDLYLVHDQQNIASVSVNLHWTTDQLRLITLMYTEVATSALNFPMPPVGEEELAAMNTYQEFRFSGARAFGDGLPISTDRQHVARFLFMNESDESCSEFCIDTSTIAIGGSLAFVDTSGAKYIPIWSGPSYFRHAQDCCLTGQRGNIDHDPSGECDISDLTQLLNYLFIDFKPPCCVSEADLAPAYYGGEPDGVVDIADLQAIIDHLFLDFGPLPACE